MRALLIGPLVLLTIFLSSTGANAATITVTTTDNLGEGSLRQAVAIANPGDTIVFSLAQSSAVQVLGEIVIDKNLTIRGPGADLLTLDASGAGRIFRVLTGVSLTVDGLTLIRGRGSLAGGGHIINAGDLTVNNCVIMGGESQNGGAIFNSDGGTLRITRTTFKQNIAGNSGGAIFNTSEGLLIVSASTFDDNSALRNGGAVANNGTLFAINSTFFANVANRGGAISNLGTLTSSNSTIIYNTVRAVSQDAPVAGGIIAAGTETLNNTIVAGNLVDFMGLRFEELNGLIDVANNNLIADAATSGGIAHGTSGNIVGNGGIGFIETIDILSFGIAPNGGPTWTAALVPGSPAINSGNNSLAVDENNNPLTTDQRGPGFPRIVGGTVDIGAFETASMYSFSGFLQPVENLPIVNLATGGSSIPVKFSLGGNHGLNIFAAGYPGSTQVACDSSEPSATIDETSTAGASSLTYDPVTDQYKYIWKTERTWRGSCRLLVVRLNDGAEHTAKFKFR